MRVPAPAVPPAAADPSRSHHHLFEVTRHRDLDEAERWKRAARREVDRERGEVHPGERREEGRAAEPRLYFEHAQVPARVPAELHADRSADLEGRREPEAQVLDLVVVHDVAPHRAAVVDGESETGAPRVRGRPSRSPRTSTAYSTPG